MYLTVCFRKLLRAPLFWVGAAGSAVICLFTGVYRNPVTQDSETVLYVLTHYTKTAMQQDVQLCADLVFRSGIGSWLPMFMPVIVSMAAVGIRLDEQNSGVWRFAEPRTGRQRYHLGTALFFLLAGGLTLLLGYALYGAVIFSCFPHISDYPAEQGGQILMSLFSPESIMSRVYQAGDTALTAAVQLFEIFLYGASGAAASLLLVSFIQNPYVVICTPFFLKYALNGICNKLFAVSAEQQTAAFDKAANILTPESLLLICSYPQNMAWVLTLHAAVMLGAAVLYCVIRNRRERDEG